MKLEGFGAMNRSRFWGDRIGADGRLININISLPGAFRGVCETVSGRLAPMASARHGGVDMPAVNHANRAKRQSAKLTVRTGKLLAVAVAALAAANRFSTALAQSLTWDS